MAQNPRSSLFEIAVQDIEAEYARLGHTLGWRFLNVSRKIIDGPVRVALITINPGGDHIPPNHPTASCENGASYLVERWGDARAGQSVLQQQVQHLFVALAAELRYEGSPSQLLESSLVSQFVPFRSARFETLPRPAESLEFARKLWSGILPISKPRLIVCLGREVQQQLTELIPQCLGASASETAKFPTGWGN